MRKIKKYNISIYIIIAIFMFSFLGCGDDDYDLLGIENQTQDVLSFHITGDVNKTFKFVEGNTHFTVSVAKYKKGRIIKMSDYIETISVFTPLDNIPLIYLSGSAIDDKVVYTSIRDRAGFYNYYIEITEEDFGLGLDKGIDFEREFFEETE